MKKLNFTYFFMGIIIIACCACVHKSKITNEPDTKGYPEDVSKIVLNKCATAGCHNTQSKDAAGGLDLSSWNHLFEGTRNGSAVFPYRADQSFLCYFINTYSDLGISLLPTMPFQQTPLSHDEVITIVNWINKGAAGKTGNIMWNDNPGRSKFYVVNQGCNSVTVFDANSALPMRYTDIGDIHQKSPHDISMSHDGAYWYAVFLGGQILEKYNSVTDSLVGSVFLGDALWSSMTISKDSKKAFVTGWNSNGSIAYVDLEKMTMPAKYMGSFVYPHGCAASADFKTLYVTAQTGNFIYKIDVTDPLNPVSKEIAIDNSGTPSIASSLDPHQIELSPDGSKYFISCQKTNEVRIFSAANDSLLAIIPTGTFPQEIEVSEQTDYLFVSCMEDQITFPGKRGSVAVINYKTNTFVKAIYTGWQPHGLYVNDNLKKVYVANRNASADGPASHHVTACIGRNGYVTMIDLNTLELVNGYKVEVGVDPYEVAVKP